MLLNKIKPVCLHNEDERCLKGTWVSEEVKVAIEFGYKVISIYKIYHFEKRSKYDKEKSLDIKDYLFVGYVNNALKEKTEASGYPNSCVSEDDKNKYIQSFFDAEGL